MKKIWLIAPFTGIEESNFQNRFLYLAKMLEENNYEVTLITSKFSHFLKKHINNDDLNYPFKVVTLYEHGYSKNVSFNRIKSHIRFSKELKKWLFTNIEKPNLIYVAYPTMSAAKVANDFAKKQQIPIIVDVQDTWPESISAAIDIEKLHYKVALYPLTLLANKIYREADGVIAVSNTYLNRAKVIESKSKQFECVYIGAELDRFEELQVKELTKSKDEIWITYIGTLSHSYDIETAILAVKQLSEKYNVTLNILGNGPDYAKLYNLAEEERVLDTSVFFRGYLPYEEMIAYLKHSDVALNAINGNSKATITNKIGDYLSAGLPILNCCEEEEVKSLITSNKLGIHYRSGDIESLVEAFDILIQDVEYKEKAATTAFKIAQSKFNRKNSYQSILKVIENTLNLDRNY